MKLYEITKDQRHSKAIPAGWRYVTGKEYHDYCAPQQALCWFNDHWTFIADDEEWEELSCEYARKGTGAILPEKFDWDNDCKDEE